jgi:hypothetical protein
MHRAGFTVKLDRHSNKAYLYGKRLSSALFLQHHPIPSQILLQNPPKGSGIHLHTRIYEATARLPGNNNYDLQLLWPFHKHAGTK